jgi:Aldo/keto reductase family
VETWRALERLVDDGQCKSIDLSDITLEKLQEIVAAARIKPAVVEVESHPYHPQWELIASRPPGRYGRRCICSAVSLLPVRFDERDVETEPGLNH